MHEMKAYEISFFDIEMFVIHRRTHSLQRDRNLTSSDYPA